jgi:hypothetical protein
MVGTPPALVLSSLESISYGGAPAPAELVRRLRAAFPHAVPATGWGTRRAGRRRAGGAPVRPGRGRRRS